MDKTTTIMELVAGYDAYSEADELNVSAATDAPATSAPCIASFGVSAVSGKTVSKTVDDGC